MSNKVEVLKTKEMQELEDKMTMLVQTGRIDNLIDLLAVVSDNIEMTTQPMVEKMIGTETNVEKIANKLFDETNKRIKVGRIENKNEIIIPKEDDFSLIVIQKN